MRFPKHNWVGSALLILSIFLAGCSRQLSECEGPQLDLNQLIQLKKLLTRNAGPAAYLVVPNPMDATGIRNVQATDNSVMQALDNFNLAGLLDPSRLDGDFLKVRLRTLTDATSLLAAPVNGEFRFNLTDPHYSETMGYYSVTSLLQYVELLGFDLIKTRPLYVMAQARDGNAAPTEVNAIYQHHYLDPSSPRTMRIYGEGQFAPGMDRDIYHHETGHFLVESITGESGIDFAGDNGAIYTQGAALHECLADYLAESVGNKNYIGKWIARNFEDIQPGHPLRSAIDGDHPLIYTEVSNSDGGESFPERYRVAEWCTRALWELRSQFVKEDSAAGAILADRMVLSAVSLLGNDTSFYEFFDALHSADETLHCGLHSRSINQAFESRGFNPHPSKINDKLDFEASPRGLLETESGFSTTLLGPGKFVGFEFVVSNSTGQVARNVRVKLESDDPALSASVYQQGLGDLPPGATIHVGGDGLPYDFSVIGEWNASKPGGLPYRLRVLVENGPETVIEGVLGQ